MTEVDVFREWYGVDLNNPVSSTHRPSLSLEFALAVRLFDFGFVVEPLCARLRVRSAFAVLVDAVDSTVAGWVSCLEAVPQRGCHTSSGWEMNTAVRHSYDGTLRPGTPEGLICSWLRRNAQVLRPPFCSSSSPKPLLEIDKGSKNKPKATDSTK